MSNVKRDTNAQWRSKGALLKLRPKTLDNFRDFFENQSERQTNRAILNRWASFAECYKREELRVHCHARTKLAEFCAIFQYNGPACWEGRLLNVVTPPTPAKASRFDPDDLDQPMLVSIVNLIEVPERAVPALSSAFVWLQPLDECLMFLSEVADHPATFSFEMWDEIAAALSLSATHQEDWKLGFSCGCLRVQKSELIHNSIKSRAEVMRDFAEKDAPLQRRRDLHRNAIHILSSLRIELRPDNLVVGLLPKDILSPSESIEFTFCTPDLETWAIERMHEVHSHHELMLRNCAQV